MGLAQATLGSVAHALKGLVVPCVDHEAHVGKRVLDHCLVKQGHAGGLHRLTGCQPETGVMCSCSREASCGKHVPSRIIG